MDDKIINFLIIGAGASGLAFALEAASHGERVRIIDKRLKRSYIGKATGVAAQSWNFLNKYKIDLKSCPNALAMRNFIFYDNNKHVAHIKVPLIDNNSPAHLFPQSSLEELMEQKLNEKGIFVEYGNEFESVETINSVNNTRIHNQNDDTVKFISPVWLIGADGAHSKIRTYVKAEFKGKAYEEKWSVAEIETNQWQSDIQAKLYLNSNGTGLFLSQSTIGKIQGIINTPFIESSLKERFTDYNLIYKREFNVALKQVLTPKIGNVWLIGDAAHIQSPVGGQGLNLAIWDGITLANALISNDLSVEKRLIKKAKKILFFTHFDYKMLSTKNLTLRFIRNIYWKLAAKYPFISTWFFNIISGK